tara:strand:+ start:3605 stop:4375 length:771 start_codon:yes stop_codon:yes gene_type:complete
MDKIKNQIRDYWNAQPCNVKRSQHPVGSQEYFTQLSENRYRMEPHALDLAEFHKWAGKSVFEIGCGTGIDAHEFAKHGARYTGIDISKESIELAQTRFKKFGLHGNYFELHDASKDLTKFGKQDLIYSYGVIHHWPDMDQILRNVKSIMHKDSQFHLMLYCKDSWKYAMIMKGLDQFEAQAGCPYAKAFTKADVNYFLGNHFDIIDLRKAHCFMYNVEEYKKGNYVLEPWFEAMPEQMRKAVKENLGWHWCIKCKK